jgi:signal transduction histidine kinase
VLTEASKNRLEVPSIFVATQVALALTAIALIYVLARLGKTRVVHVGTSLDQKVSSREASKLALRLAEQDERFQIARELAEVILQDVTAVLSQAEGGSYAAKVDPAAAIRVLERISGNARSAHQELRRLYDQLNRNLGIQAAPPGIDDLDAQVVLLREFGYTAAISHQGDRFAVTEGAGLAIYRLVFDALENIKDHVPAGASVSVDFTWVEEGMQILIKDNGIETTNRAERAVSEATGQKLDTSYDMHDDLEALVQPIVGPSITAMRERAALYGGGVEVTKVPGVGFTVSAIFPQLKNLAGVAESK